jgi:hypothetical protein
MWCSCVTSNVIFCDPPRGQSATSSAILVLIYIDGVFSATGALLDLLLKRLLAQSLASRDGECAVTCPQRRCRQAAGRHLKCDVPEMIDERRHGKAQFAHNLCPHVQRRVGIFPRLKGQSGPHVSPSESTSLHCDFSAKKVEREPVTEQPAPWPIRPAGSGGRAKSSPRPVCDCRACR